MRRITDVLINTICVKQLAGPIAMKMAVSSLLSGATVGRFQLELETR